MASSGPLRIFLSYGHDDYASLALRLKRDLEELSHQVWFDLERLKPGGDWERYIEDGLDFASAIPDVGRFVLLLTPHSVRRPDGYCLNELARAFGRSLIPIPVMVSTVEPPLSICRLQWLDMRNCFPAEEHEEQYKKQFAQLLRSLQQKQLPFEGVQQRLLSHLRPISYGDDLPRHLARFTGREWAMAEIKQWLATSRRVLWITGEAGVGKSALAAWLCDKLPEIAGYHFCRFGNADRMNARKALFSLAYQLSTQLPVYQNRLNALPLDKTEIETNLPTLFDQLFVHPLADSVPLVEKPHVLVIDALDEATQNGSNEMASLIAGELHRLPAWLRVIVTSRPHEHEINFALQALNPWKLDAGRPENLDDIRRYLRAELPLLTGSGVPSEATVDAIVQKSEGLFLYVSWVRDELQLGSLSLVQVDEFPQGLGGIYARWFERYFPDVKEYESLCRPALEAICAAREPLTHGDLSAMFARSEYQVRELITRLRSLFPVADGRVRPFHQSVRDWLTNPEKSDLYYVDVQAGERRLADFAWQHYRRGIRAMSRYCVVHAPAHLAACERKTELKELLLDPEWLRAKLDATNVTALTADFDCLSNDEHLELILGAIRLSAHVIGREADQFSSQMLGRLLSHQGVPPIKQFLDQVIKGAQTPWLRPLQPSLHPPGTALLRTFAGHSSVVEAVAVTPDGQRAVSASYDTTLKVWDLGNGRELRTLAGHSRAVAAVAVTPDGQRAVSASHDTTLKVWDLGKGRELRTLVYAVAVTPDGQRAVSASSDKTLKVWELSSGRGLHALNGHSNYVMAVAVTPDGKRAVSASYDQTLKVWELSSGRELQTLSGHTDPVYAVAVTADGQRAISASKDQTLKVWDLASGHELLTLTGHAISVRGVAVTPDGRRAVSASDDGTLKLWDLSTGRELRTIIGHSGPVYAVAVTPNGQCAISASHDQTLKVWDLVREGQPRVRAGHAGTVTAVAVTADGRRALSASDHDLTLKVWDLSTGRELRTLKSGPVYAVAMTPNGQRAVSAGILTLAVKDLSTGRTLRILSGHSNSVMAVAVTPDGKRAVSASYDQTLKVWELASGREVCTLSGHTNPVKAVAVTADGKRAVSASWDDTLKVWDLTSGREVCTLSGHTNPVEAVAVTPDGKRAVSASRDGMLKVWALSSGCELRAFTNHSSAVNAVALTTSGQRAVSASNDNKVKVWDLETGEVLATFTCESDAICCAYSDALKLIVAGDEGGQIHFLRLEEP